MASHTVFFLLLIITLCQTTHEIFNNITTFEHSSMKYAINNNGIQTNLRIEVIFSIIYLKWSLNINFLNTTTIKQINSSIYLLHFNTYTYKWHKQTNQFFNTYFKTDIIYTTWHTNKPNGN
eukprot:118919_1